MTPRLTPDTVLAHGLKFKFWTIRKQTWVIEAKLKRTVKIFYFIDLFVSYSDISFIYWEN